MFSYSGNSCSRDYFSISLGDITHESLICNRVTMPPYWSQRKAIFPLNNLHETDFFPLKG